MINRIAAFITALIAFLGSLFPGLFGSGKNIRSVDDGLVRPATWAMTDGLGRSIENTKENDNRKFVGLFYWTWHTNFAHSLTAKNATEILSAHPEILYDFGSPLWESEDFYPDGRPFYWDEPVYGYYRDTDAYVLRKQAELIADAGVDVIFFDCTNGTSLWEESYEALFEVFEQAVADGVNVPRVAFILPFTDRDYTHTDLVNLYNNIYKNGRYRDLWFFWDGKPLIMADSASLDRKKETDRKIADFFTFRDNEPSYFTKDTAYAQKIWGWCSDYPQCRFGKSLNGRTEQMCVSVAQNADKGELAAMSKDSPTVQGRSFTHGDYSYSYMNNGELVTIDRNTDNATLYGLNFQQQWDYAIANDPDFIFVDGWNEWIAGRWQEWCGTPNAFPDQFSPEFSRDAEPSNGILKDHYYCQLCENIRRFKGSEAPAEAENGMKTYYHYANSTYDRDSDGWQGLHYTNDTMRNDFIKAEVREDGNEIVFNVYTKDAVTPCLDPSWMRIFVDTGDSAENWEGFEYVVTPYDGSVQKFADGWNMTKSGDITYSADGNSLTVRVPREALGFDGEARFNFKLSDNMQQDGDIMDFYKNGDVAPGARFTFVY